MKIVTAAEMRETDRVTSERFGVPSLDLMENAGHAVAQFVLSRYPSANRIGVICGKGNNGGDGFVAARKLHEAGRAVRVLLLARAERVARRRCSDVREASGRARCWRGHRRSWSRKRPHTVFDSDVLMDAILGTGFRPPVSGLYAEAIADVECQPCPGGRGGYSIRRRCRRDGRAGWQPSPAPMPL